MADQDRQHDSISQQQHADSSHEQQQPEATRKLQRGRARNTTELLKAIAAVQTEAKQQLDSVVSDIQTSTTAFNSARSSQKMGAIVELEDSISKGISTLSDNKILTAATRSADIQQSLNTAATTITSAIAARLPVYQARIEPFKYKESASLDLDSKHKILNNFATVKSYHDALSAYAKNATNSDSLQPTIKSAETALGDLNSLIDQQLTDYEQQIDAFKQVDIEDISMQDQAAIIDNFALVQEYHDTLVKFSDSAANNTDLSPEIARTETILKEFADIKPELISKLGDIQPKASYDAPDNAADTTQASTTNPNQTDSEPTADTAGRLRSSYSSSNPPSPTKSTTSWQKASPRKESSAQSESQAEKEEQDTENVQSFSPRSSM